MSSVHEMLCSHISLLDPSEDLFPLEKDSQPNAENMLKNQKMDGHKKNDRGTAPDH